MFVFGFGVLWELEGGSVFCVFISFCVWSWLRFREKGVFSFVFGSLEVIRVRVDGGYYRVGMGVRERF